MQYNQGFFHPQHPQKYVGDAKNIVYRSGLEFRMMRYFDQRDGVIQWSSEEIKIPYIRPDDGNTHLYYPDFLVKVRQSDGGTKLFLIEVKPAKHTKPPKTPKTRAQQKRYLYEVTQFAINAAKWSAAKQWCVRHGAEFLILTEAEIQGRFK
jgi:hypothetical protein